MPSRPPARSVLIYFSFLVVTLAAYFPSFDNPFRDDDFVFIRSAAECENPTTLFRPDDRFAFYRPGALVLFWAEYRLLGIEDGGAYLGMNFRFHIVIAACLLGLLRQLGVGWIQAVVASGLFAVGFGHYGKQVMWASTSGPLSAMLLVVCSLWLSAAFLGTRPDPPDKKLVKRITLFVTSGILMLIAPAFHELGLTAPILSAALLWIRGGDPPWRKWLLLPGVITLVGWALVYVAVSGGYETYQSAAAAAVNAPGVLFRYLGFMLLPIQESGLVATQPAPVKWLLSIAEPMHVVLSVAVVAWSVYLILRGNSRTKFLVVWLYVALIPFCFIGLPERWLELRYAYFAAAPLCALISTEVLARLYGHGRALRTLALAMAVTATAASAFVTVTLERQYDAQSRSEANQQRLHEIRQFISNER